MGESIAVQAAEPSKATKAQRELPVPEAEPASRHTIPEAGLALFRSLAAAGSNQVPSHMVHVLRRAPTQQRVQLIQQYQHSYGNAFVQRLLDGKKVGKTGAPHLAHEVEPIISPSPGQPLPPEHRMAFEQALQHPLDHVRIHTSSQVNEAAQRVQAQAFTVGHNIYFADGHYKPGTPQGDRVLGHELTHVMQHDQGRVPVVAAQERAVSLPTDQLEKEAYRQEEALVEQVPKLRCQKAGSPSFHSINSGLDYLPILRRYKPVSQPDKEKHATPSPVEGKSREPAGSFLSQQPTGVQGEVASKTSRLSEPSLPSAPRITAPPVVPPKATTATEEVPTNGTSDGAALIGTETGRPPSPTVASAGPPAPEVVKTEPATGKAAEGTAVKAAPPSPRQAIAPAIGAVRHRAAGARKHSPSGRPVASAQAAAKNPQTEQTRDAATQTVAKLDAAKAEQVRRQQFRDKLKEAIKNATPEPKTESDAERVMKTGGRDASRELTGQLAIERKAAAGPLENANAAGSEVRASKTEPPPKTDLKQEPLGSPQSPVSAAPVVPAPLPAERLDYSSDRAPTDSAMAETGVTKTQLEKGNEPEFGKTLEARSTAEKHEATAEVRYRQSEAKVQVQAHHAAEAELAEGLAAMHGVRELHIGQVVGQQVGTKTKDAIERQRITDTIAGIKNETKADVDSILISMDKEAGDIFGAGLREAERAYGETFEEEKGGVGTWLTTWGSDWEELIERSLAKARAQYLEKVNEAIDKVANCIDAKVQAAKQRVAEGHNQVKDFVRGLNVNVRQFGEEALKKVEGEFEAMESEIDQRRDGLIDKLAQQYKDSYERMSAMEEKLREENKSLWQRVYDATVGLIKKILAFKDMLLSILAKAAGVIEDIISDPIGFLGNLVSAVMSGLKNFMGKIGAYLQKGLMEWLFGALAGAGLQLPETFDLKGILSIIFQLLGLTYAYFRSRAVKLIGEPVVAALEKAADVFKAFATEGVAGLWRFIKEKVTDLKSMVLDAIFDFIKERVIIAGITWIIGLLNPASAFFKACKAIYDIVMFFIERGSQIVALVNAIVDSMAAIAKGSLGAAVKWIEEALAKAIPVAIGFLAGLLGLGDITGTIRKTIEKAQEPVNKAIDWVISQAVKLVKAAGKLLGFGREKDKKDMDTKTGGISEPVPFSAGEVQHRLFIHVSGTEATVMVASAPEPLEKILANMEGHISALAPEGKGKAPALLNRARSLLSKTDKDADRFISADADAASAAKDGIKSVEHSLADTLKELFPLFGGATGLPFSRSLTMAGSVHTLTLKEEGGHLTVWLASKEERLLNKLSQVDRILKRWENYINDIGNPAIKEEFTLLIKPYIEAKKTSALTSAVSRLEGIKSAQFKDLLAELDITVKSLTDEISDWSTKAGIPVMDFSDEAIKAELDRQANEAADKVWEERKNEAQQKLEQFAAEIQTLDPEARLKYRGSLAKGRRGVSKGFAEFNPWDFDIDFFVESDKLYLEAVAGRRPELAAEQELWADRHPELRGKMAAMSAAYDTITGVRKGKFSMKLRAVSNVRELLSKSGTREFAGERHVEIKSPVLTGPAPVAS